MEKHSYFLIIGLIFGALAYYLGDKILVPFDESGLLNITSLIIMGIFLSVTIMANFTYIHVSIDKLFRKDKHSLNNAIRRAILLSLLLNFLAFLRIFKLWSTINLLLTIGIFILVELFIQTAPSKDVHDNK